MKKTLKRLLLRVGKVKKRPKTIGKMPIWALKSQNFETVYKIKVKI